MTCPNINSPDWKKLVSEVGIDKAYELYFANGMEIPNVTNDAPVKKDLWGKTVYSQSETMRRLNKAPKVAKQIIERLKKLYPEVRIYLDGLIDSKGNWVEIPPGQVGMHLRNAFVSVVAWANDSYLETPPHEFAHHYIDMFRNHPLVQEGIAKHGEERLATLMGRYFANQEIGNKTKSWIQQFWEMVRSLFGSTDIADILGEKFYNGERLAGPEYEGSGIIQYQTANDDNYKAWKNEFLDLDNEKADDIEIMNNDDARSYLNQKMIGQAYTDRSLLFPEDDVVNVDFVRQELMQFLSSLKNSTFENVRGLDSNTLDKAIAKLTFKGLSNEQIEILAKMIRDGQTTTDSEINLIYNTLIKAAQGEHYHLNYKNSIILGKNAGIEKSNVIDDLSKEIDEHQDKREALYKKHVKNPTLIKFMQKATKLTRGLINARLVGKFLSGDYNSKVSKFFYQQFNRAERKRIEIINGFENLMKGDFQKLKKGSLFQSGGKSIDDVENISVKLEDSKGVVSDVKLTYAEAINFYLMHRQEDVLQTTMGAISPNKALKEHGFVLDSLPGRETERMVFFYTDEALKQIIDLVENNFSDYISKVDLAMNYMYNYVDTTYTADMGYKLDKFKNYFPVYHKVEEKATNKLKTIIAEFRGTAAREGGGNPIKITDVERIMNNYKNAAAMYSAYAIPIENNKKIIGSLIERYKGTNVEQYIDSWKSQIERLDNKAVLFPTQFDTKFNVGLNKLMNNFSVAVLGMNPSVMLKQTVSYIAATNYIDSKYLRKAGFGVGGVVGIKPQDIMKFIKYTGISKGETILPVEWNLNKNDQVIKEWELYSPKLSYRSKGAISTSMGELLSQGAEGDIALRIKIKGKEVKISKNRLMIGLIMMDTITIRSIWNAVKLEAVDKGFVENSQEFFEYVAYRTEEIVDNTQPTFDLINRAELGQMQHPFARTITMFSSATSKLGMIVIEKLSDYINNPTPEKKRALLKAMLSTMVYTSLGVATIDLAKALLIHGFDDDDDKDWEAFERNLIGNTLSPFFGGSLIARGIMTRVDDAPWQSVMQHPVEQLIDRTITGTSSILKGDIDKGLLDLSNSLFMAKGLPAQVINLPYQVGKTI